MHFLDHANSQYILYVATDHKAAEFIGNKLAHSLTYSALYIATEDYLPKFENSAGFSKVLYYVCTHQ